MKYPTILLATAMLVLTGCGQTEFQKANGEILVWESLRGDWVFVNYWAEWCKPCLEEIPELNELDKADNITVLGVNFDGVQGQTLLNLGQSMGIEFTMLAEDPAGVFDWKLPVALPATFVVNPAGELVETRFGPQTEQELNELVRSH